MPGLGTGCPVAGEMHHAQAPGNCVIKDKRFVRYLFILNIYFNRGKKLENEAIISIEKLGKYKPSSYRSFSRLEKEKGFNFPSIIFI